MFTSGTTGPSKAVITPWAVVYQFWSWVPDDTLAPGDGLYSAMPLFHNSGRSAFNYASCSRRPVRDPRPVQRAPTFWDDVRATNCTTRCARRPDDRRCCYAAPPRADDADNPLRNVILGPMIPEMDGFEKRFGVRVVHLLRPDRGRDRPSTTGVGARPVGQLRAAARSTTRGPRCARRRARPAGRRRRGRGDDRAQPPSRGRSTSGYYKMPEQTVEAWRNGWFHTGDVFRQRRRRLVLLRRPPARHDPAPGREHLVVRGRDATWSSYADVAECAAIGIRAELGDDDVMVVRDRARPRRRSIPPRSSSSSSRDMPRFMLPRYVQVRRRPPAQRERRCRVRKHELRDRGVTDTTWDREATP